jgi:hypothetical protein
MTKKILVLLAPAVAAWTFGLSMVGIAVYAGPALAGLAMVFAVSVIMLNHIREAAQ